MMMPMEMMPSTGGTGEFETEEVKRMKRSIPSDANILQVSQSECK